MDNFNLIFKQFQVQCVDSHSLMGTAYTGKSFAKQTDYLSVMYVHSMLRMMIVKDLTGCILKQAMITTTFY